uniref:Centrosomal protein 55 n=1 Tax=Varanus komodoensis TaxID=61221 RepID=A0A8D2IWR4_VARKO
AFGLLKDGLALEKNQQWLIYDQQREAYVQSLLAKIFEMEKQLETVNQQQAKETKIEGIEDKERYYEELLAAARKALDTERHTITKLQSDLNGFKRKYDEAKQEVMNLKDQLKLHKQVDIQALQDENQIKGQTLQRLTHENEVTKGKLDDERKRSQALASQVELLHRSLLKQQEDHARIAVLEQQKLTECGGCTEAFHNFQSAFEDKLIIEDKHSSVKRTNLLDESFLECPKCKAQYPTSQHRELLAHIDFCAD